MKTQKHNQTELKELNVMIEKDVALDFEKMAENSGIPLNDLVVIALKRFRSSHLDYLRATPVVE
jgi:hypothetical protein